MLIHHQSSFMLSEQLLCIISITLSLLIHVCGNTSLLDMYLMLINNIPIVFHLLLLRLTTRPHPLFYLSPHSRQQTTCITIQKLYSLLLWLSVGYSFYITIMKKCYSQHVLSPSMYPSPLTPPLRFISPLVPSMFDPLHPSIHATLFINK